MVVVLLTVKGSGGQRLLFRSDDVAVGAATRAAGTPKQRRPLGASVRRSVMAASSGPPARLVASSISPLGTTVESLLERSNSAPVAGDSSLTAKSSATSPSLPASLGSSMAGASSPAKSNMSSLNVGGASAGAGGRVDHYGELRGFSSSTLAGMLSPRNALADQEFALTVDTLLFVGRPMLFECVKVEPTASSNGGRCGDNHGDKDDSNEDDDDGDRPHDPSCASSASAVAPSSSSSSPPPPHPSSSSSSSSSSSGRMFHVVFMLDAERVRSSPGDVQALQVLSARLASAIQHEERRCGYFSEQETILVRELDAMVSNEGVSAFIAQQTRVSSLARLLNDAAETLRGSRVNESMRLRLNDWLDIDLGVGLGARLRQHQLQRRAQQHAYPRLLRRPTVSARLSTLRGDVDCLRPYHSLLLLSDAEQLRSALFTDYYSPALQQLVDAVAVGPMRSFETISLETGVPLTQVYRLAVHMVSWQRARIVHTVSRAAVYTVHPTATCSAQSPLVREFVDVFGEGSHLPSTLRQFNNPQALAEHMAPLTESEELELTRVVCWMLRHTLLLELHTYVHLNVSTDLPPLETRTTNTLDHAMNDANENSNNSPLDDEGDDPDTVHLSAAQRNALSHHPEAHSRPHEFRLLLLVAPFFSGRHHVTEILWRTGVSRAQLNKVMSVFSDILIMCRHEADDV